MTGLSERELASLAWFGLAGVGAVFWAPLRRAVRDVVRALLTPVLLIPLALFAAYTGGMVALASLTPAWNLDLVKDTVIWFLTAGVLLMFRATNAAKEEDWFLRQAGAVLKLTVFLEFYLNFQSLPFWAEFLLQAWLLILILIDGAARLSAIRQDADLASWKRGANLLQGLTGLGLLAYVGVWLIGNWQTVDPSQTARALLLPIWLTLFTLPFVFGWAWYITWDGARSQLRRFGPGGHIGLRSRLAVVLGYHLRIRDMRGEPPVESGENGCYGGLRPALVDTGRL